MRHDDTVSKHNKGKRNPPWLNSLHRVDHLQAKNRLSPFSSFLTCFSYTLVRTSRDLFILHVFSLLLEPDLSFFLVPVGGGVSYMSVFGSGKLNAALPVDTRPRSLLLQVLHRCRGDQLASLAGTTNSVWHAWHTLFMFVMSSRTLAWVPQSNSVSLPPI